jgi:hypothetical protein
MNELNREAWLMRAVEKLRPRFLSAGYTIPELRVSVGWPSSGGLATKKRIIGQCYFGMSSADGKPQLFISPLLDDPKDPSGVLATLVHEICHVAAGPEAKHGAKFVRVMKVLGLGGKPTATHAEADLLARLAVLSDEIGPFPHAKIVPIKPPKTQTTRMIKMECPVCSYVSRTARKWLDEFGPVLCPCNKEPMKVDLGLTETEGE